MKVISQRELRNDNAEVMRGVEQGETYTVTRRGVPIARVGPLTDDAGMRCVRPASRRPNYSAMVRARSEPPTAEVLDELRGDR